MFQLSDDYLTRNTIDKMFSCISTGCCPVASTITNATICKIASGHTGETIQTLAAAVPLVV
jgi:hypothetical protein